ncbi:Aminoglycoside phosphotransferase domain-containing protein [Plasmodiophora brassicae]
MAAACGASPTLRSVCRQLVPAWADLRDDDIDVDPLLGGLSNKLWHVRLPAPGGRHPTEIVLRQFCTTSGLIDRPYEQRVFAFLADTGFAPKLFGANGEFRAEQYIRGVSLTVEEFGRPATLEVVGDLIGQFHSLEPPPDVTRYSPGCERPANVLEQCDQWVRTALDAAQHANPELVDRLRRCKDEFDRIVRPLLLMAQSPVVFCHNDVQEGNVIRSDDNEYFLIDYEYAAWNFRAYDLANSLCETVIDNQADNEHGFAIRPDLAPSPDAIRGMAVSYLKRVQALTPRGRRRSITSSAVDALIEEVKLFKPVSHLLWAAWAVAKVHGSAIEFGYAQYARARLDLFDRELQRG